MITQPLTPPTPATPTDPGQLWGRSPGERAERAAVLEHERAHWAAGGDGEYRVGAALDQLPDGEWWVFHDIPRGKGGTNVDHLVIGVGGVFTVNTKNVAGNVWVAERVLMVSGEKTNYLPFATSESRDVTRRLARACGWPGDVCPLLVFLAPPTIKAMPPDVTVLHLGNVRSWLETQPHVLTPEQAYQIVLAANQPSTWT